VEYGYPRPVSVWRGLPMKITAAFKWVNGRTYFFSGDQYYRYNDHLFRVSICNIK
jgi:matrix metalloproteinase-14 (membrane-inserted)